MTPTRWLRALVTGAVAALVLTGCLRLDLQAVVGADGTVSGTYVVAQDGEALGMTAEDREAVLASPADAEAFGLPPGTPLGVETYEDGTWVGHRYTFTGLELADLVGGAGQLSRADGTFTVAIDVAAAEDGQPPTELLLALTFPGPVLETNGSVDPADPRTVRWTADRSVATTFTAVAADGTADQDVDAGAGTAAGTTGTPVDSGQGAGSGADDADPAAAADEAAEGDAPAVPWLLVAVAGAGLLLLTAGVVAVLAHRRRAARHPAAPAVAAHPVAPTWASPAPAPVWQPGPPTGPPTGAGGLLGPPADPPRPSR